MKYRLVLGRKIDLDGIDRDAQLGKCPRHVLQALRDRLNATVHAPDGEAISLSDKLRSKISSKPEHWAAARQLSEQLSSDDVIFCTSEGIGIPVAAVCGELSVKRSYPERESPENCCTFPQYRSAARPPRPETIRFG